MCGQALPQPFTNIHLLNLPTASGGECPLRPTDDTSGTQKVQVPVTEVAQLVSGRSRFGSMLLSFKDFAPPPTVGSAWSLWEEVEVGFFVATPINLVMILQ